MRPAPPVHCLRPSPRPRGSASRAGFTLVEILIAISILSIVLAAIYSSWTAILRADKSGKQAAATVQRSRIVVRVLEDSLGSTMSFFANQRFYGFVGENGSDPMLSFVARLAKSFPRSGNFGDLDVRRLIYTVESAPDGSRQLVLRQVPVLMDLKANSNNRFIIDENNHPVVLAKNVKDFQLQFWDQRRSQWVDEWKQTNQLPRGVMVTLKLLDTAHGPSAQTEITRIIDLPSMGVLPAWQSTRMPGGPGPGAGPGAGAPGRGGPNGTTPGTTAPGMSPGFMPSPGTGGRP